MQYIARRLAMVVVSVVAIATLTFFTIRILPGSAADFLLQQQRSRAEARALRAHLGLNRPLLTQYLDFVRNTARGDFGTSYVTERPVGRDIADRLPVSIELACLGLLISLITGIPAGVLAARKRATVLDFTVRGMAMAGVAMPSFWVAVLLVEVFAVNLGVLPSSGYTPLATGPGANLRYMVLPAVTLGLGMAGSVTRMLRSAMIDSLQQDYIRTARANGLSEHQVLWRHAFRPALTPTITVVGLHLGYLLGGTVVIEQVFALPGLGRFLLNAIYERDYAVVQAMVIVYATSFMLVNLGVDLGYRLVDPRVRLGSS